MRINKLIIGLIISLLLVITLVNAVKPAPEISTGGLTIIYPKAQAFIYGQDFDLYFHVFNSTNRPQDNTTVNCTIHIYNETDNKHTVTARLDYYMNYDFEFEAEAEYFRKTGFYPYLVWCVATNGEGGFVSDEILISVDGEGELTTGNGAVMVAIILIPILLGFLIMKFVSILGDSHDVVRLGLSLLSIILTFVSLWYAGLTTIKLFLWVEMVDSITTTAYIIGWLLFFIISYFIIVMIKNIFVGIKNRKEEKFDL
jgi:hypothetical protein